jgi:hypothetical protein
MNYNDQTIINYNETGIQNNLQSTTIEACNEPPMTAINYNDQIIELVRVYRCQEFSESKLLS